MRMNIQNHIKIERLTRSQLTSSVQLMDVLPKGNDGWMLKLVWLLAEKNDPYYGMKVEGIRRTQTKK